jgi:hypothetical protein
MKDAGGAISAAVPVGPDAQIESLEGRLAVAAESSSARVVWAAWPSCGHLQPWTPGQDDLSPITQHPARRSLLRRSTRSPCGSSS